MTDEENVPLQELIPYDKNLPAEVKNENVSFLTSILLTTVWGWKRASHLSRAQAEYYNSVASVAESIHHLNESIYRVGTVKERVTRDAEIEKLQSMKHAKQILSMKLKRNNSPWDDLIKKILWKLSNSMDN